MACMNELRRPDTVAMNPDMHQGPNGSMVATRAALDDKGPLTLPAPNGAGQREARGCAADWMDPDATT
jgi:hypothetical protein